ncbi:ATP-binding protein [Achromobacter sp. DMS1]|uniref:ATP-binding protein n=1 Tax=Achromobacter sp. DMS1 TaxID=1688405 RepID=UPI0026F4688D|nr:ATP-binding protein [Achromobacter sp. DMS1]
MQHYRALAAEAAEKDWTLLDYLEQTLRAERDARQLRSRQTLVRMAAFPAIKTLDEYDYGFAVGAPRAQIDELATLRFIERGENVVLLGPSGVPAPSLFLPSRPGWRQVPRTMRSRKIVFHAEPPPTPKRSQIHSERPIQRTAWICTARSSRKRSSSIRRSFQNSQSVRPILAATSCAASTESAS